MKASLRVLSLILVAALLFGVMPAAFADNGETGSIDELMEKFDERVQKPKEKSILDEPQTMIVLSEHGNFIYALSKPGSGAKLFEVEEGTRVTVYARQNGFALAVTEDGAAGGWMSEKLLEKAPAEGEEPSPRLIMASVMSHFSSAVQKPRQSDLLDEPLRMKVESQHGNYIYARTRPVDGVEIFTIPEGSIVIVYAKQNGCFLGALEDDSAAGWMKEKLLVPEDDEATGNGIERDARIDEIMMDFNSGVQRPKKACLLDEPVKMQINAKYGRVVVVMSRIGTGKLFEAEHGSTMTVYARQNGWALAMSEDGTIGGWVNEKFLTPAGK